MSNKALVAVIVLTLLAMLVVSMWLGWGLQNLLSNTRDTTIYVSQKYAHPFTTEYCNPATEDNRARVCYKATIYSYKVSTSDNRILTVTSEEVYNALAEGGNYRVRLCGSQELVVCGVFGKEQK